MRAMTARALTAAAAIAAAIALAGCGVDDASTPTVPATTATVATREATPPATTSTTPVPAAAVPVLDDPRAPSTPALRHAARAFFTAYVAYIYGTDPRLPAPATEQLQAQLAARGPITGLEHLHPRLRELRVAPIAADLTAVSASVDDGRKSGELQEIPARMRLIDGQWQAVSVAAGERE
jgi:hypothetical protein